MHWVTSHDSLKLNTFIESKTMSGSAVINWTSTSNNNQAQAAGGSKATIKIKKKIPQGKL
jgi:hypothetical protein